MMSQEYSKLYERRRLRKLEAYHKGFIDALLACEQEFGADDFFEQIIDLHREKIEHIQKRIKGLPKDEEEC
jgi:hypothetical protein